MTTTATARRAADWMFRDRTTGKVVVAQRPNVPLTAWLVCLAAGWLTHPHGGWATGLHVVGTVALVVWAGEEIVRGVNPWRRTLGAGVLLALVVTWIVSP